MEIKKPKCCGTCKNWENSSRPGTVFEQFNSTANCRSKGTIERYASKCKDYNPKVEK